MTDYVMWRALTVVGFSGSAVLAFVAQLALVGVMAGLVAVVCAVDTAVHLSRRQRP